MTGESVEIRIQHGSTMRIPTLAAAAFFGLQSFPISAQVPLFTLTSPTPAFDGRFGTSIAFAGDLTGDGVSEIAVGAERESDGASPRFSGRVHLFDGSTGELIRTLVSPTEAHTGLFGYIVVNVGDADSDGVDDLLVGAPLEHVGNADEAGKVHLFSGASGALIRSIQSPNAAENGLFGIAASRGGDVLGDGSMTLLVGAVGEEVPGGPPRPGRAYVFSMEGSVLHVLTPLSGNGNSSFGHSVASVGDIDADGHADLVVGAPNAGENYEGIAHLFSGASGSELVTMNSPNWSAYGRFGISIAAVGDVTGDGLPEYVIGASGDTPATSPLYAGRVHVREPGGTMHMEFGSPDPRAAGAFGRSIARAGDMTGDGVMDLLVSATGEGFATTAGPTGAVHVISGVNGDRWTTLVSPNPRSNGVFGRSIAGEIDLDGDGIPEILVGAEGESTSTSTRCGRAYVFAGGALVDSAAPPVAPVVSVWLSPNPIAQAGTIYWTAPAGRKTSIVLHDVLGRNLGVIADAISNGKPQSVRWNRRDVPAGTYVLRLYSESESVATMITVLR